MVPKAQRGFQFKKGQLIKTWDKEIANVASVRRKVSLNVEHTVVHLLCARTRRLLLKSHPNARWARSLVEGFSKAKRLGADENARQFRLGYRVSAGLAFWFGSEKKLEKRFNYNVPGDFRPQWHPVTM